MTTLADVPLPVAPGTPARPIRPTRGDVLEILTDLLADLGTSGGHAAWQGPASAPQTWRTSTGAADLDIWCDADGFTALSATLATLQAATVQRADRPGRLQHISFAIETLDGLAVVDLTRGDLMVGPVLLVPAADIRVALEPYGPVLDTVAGAADLAVRPLLRGRLVDGARLDEARCRWLAADDVERATFVARMRDQLGAPVAEGIAALLDGRPTPRHLVRNARRALARRSLAPRSLAATWASRRTVLPAGRRAGVLGLRTAGCLVVLVGTDGSGKSTVAREIDARLTRAGLRTSTAYLGMARGNLPGVGLARRVLGVAPAGDHAESPSAEPAERSGSSLDHATVRRIAAWYYAVEYGYRWWRDIRPGLRHGGVVVSDRYVYDLRESPWPGSTASRVAEWFVPRPDVLVLPDAPDRVIHARKPERPAHEQAAQQDRFRALVAENPAGTASLLVDTSGMSPVDVDPIAPVVSAVVTALHRLH